MLECLRKEKGYGSNEPALVEFEVLEELLDLKNSLLREVKVLKDENLALKNKLDRERKANMQKEADYLEEMLELEKKLSAANKKASNILASDLTKKMAKKNAEKVKVISRQDLLLKKY